MPYRIVNGDVKTIFCSESNYLNCLKNIDRVVLEPGFMPHDEFYYRHNRVGGLIDLVNKLLNKDSVILEIGTHMGISTCVFAYLCKEVFTCDMQSIKSLEYEILMQNMRNFNNIHVISKNSRDLKYDFDDKFFDFIYIDACHEYADVKNDILNFLPKVKTGGYIAGHDYENKYAGNVKQAVDEIFRTPDEVFTDTSWVKKIIE